jgi:hypothetical protein
MIYNYQYRLQIMHRPFYILIQKKGCGMDPQPFGP